MEWGGVGNCGVAVQAVVITGEVCQDEGEHPVALPEADTQARAS